MATMNFTVSRTKNTVGAATLNYAVVGIGANPARPADFEGGAMPSGTVDFADGDTTATIALDIAAGVGQGRTFAVRISSPSIGLVRQASAAGVIAVAEFGIAPG